MSKHFYIGKTVRKQYTSSADSFCKLSRFGLQVQQNRFARSVFRIRSFFFTMTCKSICLFAIILSASNFGNCLLRGERPQLKDTLGNEIPYYSVVRDGYEYTVIEPEKYYPGVPEWKRLSDDYWPTKNPKKRFIATAGNRNVAPRIIGGSSLPRDYDDEPELLLDLLKNFRITKSVCCAAQCPYSDGEPVYMEGRSVLYKAVIEYVNLEYLNVGYAGVTFVGENFGCKCSTESEADHQKIQSCPLPSYNQEFEGHFCDSIETPKAYKICLDKFPDWAKESLKPIEN